MRARSRTAAGLMLGTIVGVLGPVLGAVAWHSGNASGNDPLVLDAATNETYVLTAAWNMDLDSNVENGFPDHFLEITAGRTAAAAGGAEAQAVSTSFTGEVVAWRPDICVDATCYPAGTWRGSVDAAGGNVLLVDPATAITRFSGTLVEESSGEPCGFEVAWNIGLPDSTESGQDLTHETLQKLDADLAAMTRRDAYPGRVDAPDCWPYGGIAGFWTLGADGAIYGSTSASLLAEDASHGCVRLYLPRADRVCWRDEH